MTGHSGDSDLAAAFAAAKLRAIRMGLLGLHKAVLDAERRRYERTHGPIESAHRTLQLVIGDPWFAWVRPLAELIVQGDERLADERPIRMEEVDAYSAQVRGLLHDDTSPEPFRVEYHRSLQDVPDIVVSHAQILALLSQTPGQSG